MDAQAIASAVATTLSVESTGVVSDLATASRDLDTAVAAIQPDKVILSAVGVAAMVAHGYKSIKLIAVDKVSGSVKRHESLWGHDRTHLRGG